MRHYLLSAFAVLLSLGTPSPAHAQGLTTFDSTGVLPRRVYVVLNDASFITHHVEAHSQRESFYTHKTETVTLEIFNILIPLHPAVAPRARAAGFPFIKGDTLLVSLSVLPDSSGAAVWQPVVLDSVPPARVQSLATVVRECKRRLVAYRQAGNPKNCRFATRINLFPVVRRQGRYWVPKQDVLTEYFLVRTRATRSLAQTDYVTLNIKGPRVSSAAPWRTIRALLPSDRHYEYSPALGLVHETIRNGVYSFWCRAEISVISESFRFLSKESFRFLPKNNIYSSDLIELGIGSFDYKPGIGIVAGEYPSYFNISNPWVPFKNISIDGFSAHKSN